MVLAQEEARMLNHDYIGTEHILLGLVREGEGVAAMALRSMGVSLEAVRSQVEDIIGQGSVAPTGHIPFTPRAKKVLELSLREAMQLGHNYIGTEHILLGLIREGEGVAAQVLIKLGAGMSRVRRQVIQILGGEGGVPIHEGLSEIHEGVPEVRHRLGRYVFSEEGWAIVQRAAQSAAGLRVEEIGSLDFLIALMTTDDPAVAELLGSWGVRLDEVRARIEELAAREEAGDDENAESDEDGDDGTPPRYDRGPST